MVIEAIMEVVLSLAQLSAAVGSAALLSLGSAAVHASS